MTYKPVTMIVFAVGMVALLAAVILRAGSLGSRSEFTVPDQSRPELVAANAAIVSALEARLAQNGPVACAIKFLSVPSGPLGETAPVYLYGDCRALQGRYEWVTPVVVQLHRGTDSTLSVDGMDYSQAIGYEEQEAEIRALFPEAIAEAILSDSDGLLIPSDSSVARRIDSLE
jgi:hypothetical protein